MGAPGESAEQVGRGQELLERQAGHPQDGGQVMEPSKLTPKIRGSSSTEGGVYRHPKKAPAGAM